MHLRVCSDLMPYVPWRMLKLFYASDTLAMKLGILPSACAQGAISEEWLEKQELNDQHKISVTENLFYCLS